MLSMHIGAVLFESPLAGHIMNGSNMPYSLFYCNRVAKLHYQKLILDLLSLFQAKGVCRKLFFLISQTKMHLVD